MNAKEKEFVNEIFEELEGQWHASKVESHSSSPGIPDIDYCVNGFCNNMEVKYGDWFKCPEVRPTQVFWFNERIKKGGKPIIIAKIVHNAMVYYCVFSGDKINKLQKLRRASQWLKYANVMWDSEINPARLLHILQHPELIPGGWELLGEN